MKGGRGGGARRSTWGRGIQGKEEKNGRKTKMEVGSTRGEEKGCPEEFNSPTLPYLIEGHPGDDAGGKGEGRHGPHTNLVKSMKYLGGLLVKCQNIIPPSTSQRSLVISSHSAQTVSPR